MNFSNLNAFFTCTLHVSLRLIGWKVRASGLSYLMGRIFCRLVQLKKQILAVFCFTDANETWQTSQTHSNSLLAFADKLFGCALPFCDNPVKRKAPRLFSSI